MTALFPDPYFHVGGDENNGKHWKANAQIQAYMKANNITSQGALHAVFSERILKILTKYNKKMMGWDEIFYPGLSNNILIQSWRGKKFLYDAAAKGHQTILSNGYYIDLMYPTNGHYLNDPLPADNPLTPTQQKLILGGEAAMWSEFATPENIDSRIWPRTAAIAERFWSPRTVNDVDDMYRRLDAVSLDLEYLGLMHEKNYEMMLRRLTQGTDITPLKTLVDVIEPLKEYTRHRQGTTYTSLSPYTLVADVARADAKVARQFRNLVKTYKAQPTKQTATEINYWLSLWKNNNARLQPLIKQVPALREIETLSADLATVSQIGLDALQFINANKNITEPAKNQPAATWYDTSMATLKEAKKPRAKTELMVVSGIEDLVKMAAGK